MLPYQLKPPRFGKAISSILDGQPNVQANGGPIQHAFYRDLILLEERWNQHQSEQHGTTATAAATSTASSTHHVPEGTLFASFQEVFGKYKTAAIHLCLPSPRCDQEAFSQLIYASAWQRLQDAFDAFDAYHAPNGGSLSSISSPNNGKKKQNTRNHQKKQQTQEQEYRLIQSAGFAVWCLYTLYKTNPLPLDCSTAVTGESSNNPLRLLPLGLTHPDNPRWTYRRAFRQPIRVTRHHYNQLQQLRDLCLVQRNECQAKLLMLSESKKKKTKTWCCQCGMAQDTMIVLDRLFDDDLLDFCEYIGPVGLEALAGHADWPYASWNTKPSAAAAAAAVHESLVSVEQGKADGESSRVGMPLNTSTACTTEQSHPLSTPLFAEEDCDDNSSTTNDDGDDDSTTLLDQLDIEEGRKVPSIPNDLLASLDSYQQVILSIQVHQAKKNSLNRQRQRHGLAVAPLFASHPGQSWADIHDKLVHMRGSTSRFSHCGTNGSGNDTVPGSDLSSRHPQRNRTNHSLTLPDQIHPFEGSPRPWNFASDVDGATQRHLDDVLQTLVERDPTFFQLPKNPMEAQVHVPSVADDVSSVGVGGISVATGQGRAAIQLLLDSSRNNSVPHNVATHSKCMAVVTRQTFESPWAEFLNCDQALNLDDAPADSDSSALSDVSSLDDEDHDEVASTATSAVGRRALETLLNKVKRGRREPKKRRKSGPSRKSTPRKSASTKGGVTSHASKRKSRSQDNNSLASSVMPGQEALQHLLDKSRGMSDQSPGRSASVASRRSKKSRLHNDNDSLVSSVLPGQEALQGLLG